MMAKVKSDFRVEAEELKIFKAYAAAKGISYSDLVLSSLRSVVYSQPVEGYKDPTLKVQILKNGYRDPAKKPLAVYEGVLYDISQDDPKELCSIYPLSLEKLKELAEDYHPGSRNLFGLERLLLVREYYEDITSEVHLFEATSDRLKEQSAGLIWLSRSLSVSDLTRTIQRNTYREITPGWAVLEGINTHQLAERLVGYKDMVRYQQVVKALYEDPLPSIEEWTWTHDPNDYGWEPEDDTRATWRVTKEYRLGPEPCIQAVNFLRTYDGAWLTRQYLH